MTCKVCKKDMHNGESCIVTHLIVTGKKEPVPRIKFGDEEDGWGEGEKCGDCGVKRGGQHHPDCDIARCPMCGGQESFCECPIESYAVVEKKETKQNNCSLCGNVLDYDLDGACMCHSCGYLKEKEEQ